MNIEQHTNALMKRARSKSNFKIRQIMELVDNMENDIKKMSNDLNKEEIMQVYIRVNDKFNKVFQNILIEKLDTE